jgi:hypothetical protein
MIYILPLLLEYTYSDLIIKQMETEIITLHEVIASIASWQLQNLLRFEIVFNEDNGELDDYYLGQYEYDLQNFIYILKNRIVEDQIYDFKNDYECQGRYDGWSFVGSPYPDLDNHAFIAYLLDISSDQYGIHLINEDGKPPLYLK